MQILLAPAWTPAMHEADARLRAAACAFAEAEGAYHRGGSREAADEAHAALLQARADFSAAAMARDVAHAQRLGLPTEGRARADLQRAIALHEAADRTFMEWWEGGGP